MRRGTMELNLPECSVQSGLEINQKITVIHDETGFHVFPHDPTITGKKGVVLNTGFLGKINKHGAVIRFVGIINN